MNVNRIRKALKMTSAPVKKPVLKKLTKSEVLKFCNLDPFPSKVSDAITQFDYPEKFKCIWGHKKIDAFLLFMDHNLIHYKYRTVGNYEEHYLHVGKESKTFGEFRPNDIKWGVVAGRFKISTAESGRKNTDTRMFFTCGNTFLVKAYFTFGQRIVEPGTAHVYQTLSVPLLFYVNNHPSIKFVSKSFPYQDVHLFDRFILLPDTCYRIPPGTKYFIFSTQKNYFSLDIVAENHAMEITFKDPLKERVTKIENPYDLPCKTPHVDAIEDDEEENLSDFFLADQPEPSVGEAHEETDFQNPFANFQQMVQTDAVAAESQEVQLELQNVTLNEFQQPEVTYYIIPKPLPILEKNIIVSDTEFITNYQKLKTKQTTDPCMPDIQCPLEEGEEPMDLSIDSQILNWDEFFVPSQNENIEEINDIINDICSPLAQNEI